MAEEFVALQELAQAARRNLDQGAWNYLLGGAESETTMRRNRLGFDKLAFRPRVLRDVAQVDPSTTLIGQKLRIPVILAPVGGLSRFHPEGAVASGRAAGAFGTLQTVSSVTGHTYQEVADGGPAPRIFQLYIRDDWEWLANEIDAVKAAGYIGWCVTVDTAVGSRRERVIIAQRQRPASSGWMPGQQRRWGASVTWETIDRIKDRFDGPIAVKGIATAEDAAIAVEHGVDIVWVSNHGGRQLDYGEATIDMLPEIVRAVSGRAQIVLDSGIQRGSDVLKAIALGADAVAVGKLQGFAVGAAGEAGVAAMFDLLEEEIAIDMALLGVTNVKQLNPSYITKADPVVFPHEMSSWSHIPEGRLL